MHSSGFTSLSPLSLAGTADVTLGTSGRWLGAQPGAGDTTIRKLFWPQSMVSRTTGDYDDLRKVGNLYDIISLRLSYRCLRLQIT